MNNDSRPGIAIRIRRALKESAERALGVKIYSVRAHGRDDCTDIRSCGDPISVIVDVGANVGQSAMKFREAFPAAVIHCIEPVDATFRSLEANTAHDPRIECHRVALDDHTGSGAIWLTGHSTTASLIEPAHATGVEAVPISTLDELAASLGLVRIDLLKVDAEGADFRVLKGAQGLLSAGHIGYVLVEVGFDRRTEQHVLFDAVRDLLAEHRFSLLGIYDQTLEWSGEKRLRYANACFRYDP